MLKRTIIMAVLAAPLFATTAHAQKWDAPLFFSPRPADDVGLYYTKTDDDFFGDPGGIRVIWRQTGNLNLGFHAGIGDLDDAGETILLGAEFSQPLALGSGSGLITQWTLGAGAVFGDNYIELSVPAGVSLGLNLGSGGMSFLPFAHPRVSFDVAAITDEFDNEETVTDFGWAIDLGAEIGLGERFLIRAAYTLGGENDLGQRDAFGVGAALRIPRKVSVR